MKAFSKLRILHMTLAATILFTMVSCEDDEVPKKDNNSQGVDIVEINDFIYTNMNIYYYWNLDMPKIDYRTETNPEMYFYKLIKQPEDRYSFITDDVEELEKYFDGVVKSPGYSVQPYFFKQGSRQVIVFIEYVYANSPASEAGLKRGDMIYKINDQILDDQNYITLLSLEEKVITLGTIVQGEIVELSPKVTVKDKENLVQNPIVATNIIEEGGHKTGYLAYTSFIANYDDHLASVFQQFKAAGVTDLVLDLRYNGGGYVSSAQKLASMIAPASVNGEVLMYQKFNFLLKSINDTLLFKVDKASNLDLDRVYILTTGGTASASEIIIYGLEPYMEVIQIGETTYGKYHGSITISDNDIEPEKRRHSWAIQPIVMESDNANSSIDYLSGMKPDFEMKDNYYNADLGDPEEHFLAAALEHIYTGTISEETLKTVSLKSSGIISKPVMSLVNPLYGTMLVETPSLDK